jgi:DNA-binding transcriptional LysR family regulator
MDAVRKAHHAMEELSEGVVGEIRIGTANSVGIYFLPQVLWRMREKYPRAHPSVVYRQANELIDLLLEHRLDIVLVANPRQDRRLQQETVVKERVSLVCGRTHPFFGKLEVDPKELQGLQFILLSTNNPTGQLIQDYLAQLKVNVEPMIYTDNTETVKKMVEVGLGVAFLPDMVTASDVVCDEEPSGKLARIDVGPPLIRTIDMVTWKNSEMNRAMNAFIDELKKHAANWRGCTENAVS